MSAVQVVDVADGGAFDDFYAAYAGSFTRDIDCPWLAVEKRVNLQDDAWNTKVAVVARDASGRTVGGGTVVMPLQDNTAFAFLEMFTLPAHRRRGHATAVLDTLAQLARDHGRSTAFGFPQWGVDVPDDPARLFTESHGFELDVLDAVRQLDLPADLPALRLDPGYELETWRGPCPEQWVEEYADLRRILVQEAPNGDAGLENEHWDVERVRQDEADTARANRQMQVTVARAADGSLVGHTQLSFPGGVVEVYQWDTLVRPAHRGHGLGLALKIHTMHAAADLLEGRRRITTYNAASNAPMIAVNEALGFRQTAWAGEYVRAI